MCLNNVCGVGKGSMREEGGTSRLRNADSSTYRFPEAARQIRLAMIAFRIMFIQSRRYCIARSLTSYHDPALS